MRQRYNLAACRRAALKCVQLDIGFVCSHAFDFKNMGCCLFLTFTIIKLDSVLWSDYEKSYRQAIPAAELRLKVAAALEGTPKTITQHVKRSGRYTQANTAGALGDIYHTDGCHPGSYLRPLLNCKSMKIKHEHYPHAKDECPASGRRK